MPIVHNAEDSQLVEELLEISKKSPKLVRSSTHAAPDDPSIEIRSWKMNEFKYYDIPSPFPTLARGLFTHELPEASETDEGTSREPRYRIVVRGYDKFFNMDEVPWTNWISLEEYTSGPYTLTVKSNGCIIFIAAITPSKIIVTSKHSLGPMKGVTESHAEAGHRWLRKHLADQGKTEEGLAGTLWQKNWTAVAELCDDEFEEHVLPYPPEKSGLHLHGINESTRAFRTLPSKEVDAFAEEWGFIKTPWFTLPSIQDVKKFTDEVKQTGRWNGEAIEGFVVRTHVTEPKDLAETQMSPRKDVRAPPYPPGSSFFFKVKFDEPYLMYRDWREITKILLSTKGAISNAKIPKSKLKRRETQTYVKWAIKEIQRNPEMFKDYQKGRGIISTRETFLEWLHANEGEAGALQWISDSPEPESFKKTIIVPIAVPGCGKTAVSVALAHIFGFAHTQSDDLGAKKKSTAFIKSVTDLLKKHDVVIADKNNHLRSHREQLRDAIAGMRPSVRLLALNWALDRPPATIHRICADRVQERGENHQTLVADSQNKAHEDVIWLFLRKSEELGVNEVNETIEMDVEEDLEQAVERAVSGCVKILGLNRPTQEKIEEALVVAKGYRAPRTSTQSKPKAAALKPRYFSLMVELDLQQVIGKHMQEVEDPQENLPYDGWTIWNKLVGENRIARQPHVTIVHSNSLQGEEDLWDRCMRLHHMPIPPTFKIKLGHLVWNKRIMAITVDNFNVDLETGAKTLEGQTLSDVTQEGSTFVSMLPFDVQQRLHITLGIIDDSIKPVEAKALVQSWRAGRTKDSGSLVLGDVTAKGRIKANIS